LNCPCNRQGYVELRDFSAVGSRRMLHAEWTVRRSALAELLRWQLG
jgi:hypothetical protein